MIAIAACLLLVLLFQLAGAEFVQLHLQLGCGKSTTAEVYHLPVARCCCCCACCRAQELILFSRADLERSIPSVVDGLKPGQRKILYCCFKRNLKKDIKVRGWLVQPWGRGADARPWQGCSAACACRVQMRLLARRCQALGHSSNPLHLLAVCCPPQVAQLAGYVSEHSAYHHCLLC